jgi:hypothetical protein
MGDNCNLFVFIASSLGELNHPAGFGLAKLATTFSIAVLLSLAVDCPQ